MNLVPYSLRRIHNMSLVSVGMLVKISPNIITAEIKDDDLVGDLGMPGLMRHAILEVISISKDGNLGEIAVCRITNPEVFKQVIPGVKEVKYEGEPIFLLKDLVPANMKTTLVYTIKTAKTKEQMIVELFAERENLRRRGMDKRNREMKENWKQIQILRGEITGPMPAVMGVSIVNIPKFKMNLEVSPKDLPTSDPESVKKFERFLTAKIRELRASRRANRTKTVMAFGTVPVEKQGLVYLKEGSLLKAYEEMMKTTLETDKKPIDSKANYIGVEVEFSYRGNYDILKKLLIENKLHKYVCLKDDGSLRSCHNTNYRTKELTLICKNTEIESVLKRLDTVLAHPEIDGYANRSCGLHVHLDMRNRNAPLVYKNLVRVQNILRGAQPVGRVNNVHCKPNTNENLGEYTGDENRNERYWVVNGSAYAKHQSIEIRIHEGTTDCEAIYNWCSFLDALASHTKEIPKNEYKFAEDLAARLNINIPINAIDYVDRRIERFKSLSVVS